MFEKSEIDLEKRTDIEFEKIKEHFLVKKILDFIEVELPKKYPELAERFAEVLPYHGKAHALDVIHESLLFALADGTFSGRELELLGIAAAFHDSGFIMRYDNNEVFGAEFAVNQMKEGGDYTDEEIARVQNAILSTEVQFEPGFNQLIKEEKLGKILADADVSNFGRQDFLEKRKAVFDELKGLGKITDSFDDKRKFNEFILRMLETHKWNTEIARKFREKQEQKNLDSFKKGEVA